MKRRKDYRDSFDYKGFAQRLHTVRLSLGLTVEQAAKAAHVTPETWRHYETIGRGRITLAIGMFTQVYPVNLDWLIAGDAAGISPTLNGRVASNVVFLPVRNDWRRASKI